MSSKAARVISSEAELLSVLSAQLQAGQLAPVWAYIRVSTRQQKQEGLSLEGQRDAILAYCEQNKLPEPIFVSEVGSAGKPLLAVHLPGAEADGSTEGAEARPLLTLLLAALTDGGNKGRCFIVWKLDRLSRAGEEQETLLRLLWRAEVDVRSTYASETAILTGDRLDAGRALMRQIYAAFAQYERSLITARTQMGARAKAARGGWSAGLPPFGYRMVDRDLKIDPEQSRIVLAIFLCRKRMMSLQQTLDFLRERFGPDVPIRHRSHIHRLLHNRALYEGVYRDPYGGTHARPDLRILPVGWESQLEEGDIHMLNEVSNAR